MAEYEIGKWERPLPFPLLDPESSEYTENIGGDMTLVTPNFF